MEAGAEVLREGAAAGRTGYTGGGEGGGVVVRGDSSGVATWAKRGLVRRHLLGNRQISRRGQSGGRGVATCGSCPSRIDAAVQFEQLVREPCDDQKDDDVTDHRGGGTSTTRIQRWT